MTTPPSSLAASLDTSAISLPLPNAPRPTVSHKASQFTESVIREMSRLAARYEAVNLAQGMPDFPCPPQLKEAACRAILEDINQYAITWGDAQFRQAFAKKTSQYLGIPVQPDTDVTVTCGATEAMAAALLALVNPGDEVIVFEPYYENYGADAILAGAVPRYVTLYPPDAQGTTWTFREDELRRAFNNKTKALVINTPHNPTGKVFTVEELTLIASLCQQWGVVALCDEIYEHILYDDARHVTLASLPGMLERTVIINGMSKTYSVTGWRIGTVIAPAELTGAIRKVHDFLTVGAPAPLQRAGVTALQLPADYYDELGRLYAMKRQLLIEILDHAGVRTVKPEGAYYVMANIAEFGFPSDVAFTHFLVKDVGVAVVPGSSFFSRSELGHKWVRFCFCKREDTLAAARERLSKLRETLRLSVRN
jgi:aminotransferase